MKKRVTQAILLLLVVVSTLCIAGCSLNEEDNAVSSEMESSETIASEISSDASKPQSASPSGYTSIDIELYDISLQEPVENITVIDLDIMTQIDELVAQMLENNDIIEKPLPPAGGTPVVVHLIKSNETETVYRVLGEVAALKEDGEYTKWYNCDKELFRCLRRLVLPNE